MASTRRTVGQGALYSESFQVNVSASFEGLDPCFLLEALGDMCKKAMKDLLVKKGMNLAKAWDPLVCVSEDESIIFDGEDVSYESSRVCCHSMIGIYVLTPLTLLLRCLVRCVKISSL